MRLPSPVLELVEDPASIPETVQIVHRKLALMFESLQRKGFGPLIEEVLSHTGCKSRAGLELDIAKQIWRNFDLELLHMDDARFALVAMRVGRWYGEQNTAWLVHEAFPEHAASTSARVETALRLEEGSPLTRCKYRFLDTAPWRADPISETSTETLRARWDAHRDLEARFYVRSQFDKSKMHTRQTEISERITKLYTENRLQISPNLCYSIRKFAYSHDYMPDSPAQLLGVALAYLRECNESGKATRSWLKEARAQLSRFSDCSHWFNSMKAAFDRLSDWFVVQPPFLTALLEKRPKDMVYIISLSPPQEGYFANRA